MLVPPPHMSQSSFLPSTLKYSPKKIQINFIYPFMAVFTVVKFNVFWKYEHNELSANDHVGLHLCMKATNYI